MRRGGDPHRRSVWKRRLARTRLSVTFGMTDRLVALALSSVPMRRVSPPRHLTTPHRAGDESYFRTADTPCVFSSQSKWQFFLAPSVCALTGVFIY